MRLLLLSNSTNVGENYLEYAQGPISDFLGEKKMHIAFIPYAAVSFSYDDYEAKVNKAFKKIGHQVRSIHHSVRPEVEIREADALIIGGGNTWMLVYLLQKKRLIPEIQKKIQQKTPYIGWSAGSVIASPTLATTNDMPIIFPENKEALGVIPFQINAHYFDTPPKDHNGETRQQRILEYITVNQEVHVVGLREGTLLKYENDKLRLIGEKTVRIFKYGEEIKEISFSESLNFLLNKSN